MLRLSIIILMCSGVLANICAHHIPFLNDYKPELEATYLVCMSAGFVIAVYIMFSHIHETKWLILFAPLALLASMALSFNAGERNVSGYQSAVDTRQSLLSERKDLIASLPACRESQWCKSAGKEQRLRQISDELKAIPLASSVGHGSVVLPYVIGFGPDICVTGLAVVMGIRNRKKQKPEPEKKKSWSEYGSNIVGIGSKIKKKVVPIAKKFPTVGFSKKNKGNATKKGGTRNRKPRVPSKDDIRSIESAIEKLANEGTKKPTQTDIARIAGVHKQKVSHYMKGIKEARG